MMDACRGPREEHEAVADDKVLVVHDDVDPTKESTTPTKQDRTVCQRLQRPSPETDRQQQQRTSPVACHVDGQSCKNGNTQHLEVEHLPLRHKLVITGPGSRYVKLNVGGSLFNTTIATLTKHDSMLRAMFSGRMEVLSDKDGWILIDRSGKHFATILNFLRDGSVALPDCRQEVRELLAEATYFCIQGLIDLCQTWLDAAKKDEVEPTGVCRIPIISTKKEADRLIHSTNKPVIKLLLNRHNNKYSYTNQSDDNLLKNLELFDRLIIRFNERILFIKDIGAENAEVCQWVFFGQGQKKAEVCCTSIVYATDKKHTKVEFPEARIYEEAMNILLFEEKTQCPQCGGDSKLCSGGGTGGQMPPMSPTSSDRDKIRKARIELKSSLSTSAATSSSNNSNAL